MKTFLTSPITISSSREELKSRLRSAAVECPHADAFMKHMGQIFRGVFQFDHLIFMEPSVYSARNCNVWPSYKGNSSFVWGATQEQDGVVLNSYHDTLVRICTRNDFRANTISLLLKYMKEANSDDFSLLFMRKIVQDRFICLVGLVAFRKDAFSERDVSELFAFEKALDFVWSNMLPKHSKGVITPHDSDFFSLVNLPGMQNVMKQIYKVSKEDIPVLLLGETGTGKEGVANIIYRGSGRWNRPFIKINCGGFPLSLVESKLFGYVKGAFTGADKDTPGCFELANTGVLLLDELGELPLEAQTHLLRVLQEGVIERVGSSIEVPVNVRIIAATNRNLMKMVDQREFRQDLLYRLGIFPIYLPPLRKRPDDIPVLLDFFILQQSKKQGFVSPPKLPLSELKRLCRYPWPGNIREMKNAVTRAMLLWDGSKENLFSIEVGQNLFEGMVLDERESFRQEEYSRDPQESLRIEDVERRHIIRVLGMTKGRVIGKGGAAELLDINPSTLRSRMTKLGIKK